MVVCHYLLRGRCLAICLNLSLENIEGNHGRIVIAQVAQYLSSSGRFTVPIAITTPRKAIISYSETSVHCILDGGADVDCLWYRLVCVTLSLITSFVKNRNKNWMGDLA